MQERVTHLSVIVNWTPNLGFITSFCIWPGIGFICTKYMLSYTGEHLVFSVKENGLNYFPHTTFIPVYPVTLMKFFPLYFDRER